MVMVGTWARGFDALGSGRPADALPHLEEVARRSEVRGLLEPSIVPWQPDLVETYARLGRREDARRVLRRLAEQANASGGSRARAVTCRCHGLIDHDFDRHFGEALALHGLTPTPFERARTELAFGRGGSRVPPRVFSPRELQVALAVATGLTNREVAARLFLSEKTVERHLGSVFRLLGLRSRTELAVRMAREVAGSPAGPEPRAR
jgi:DNA-binding CsgD family transcriptional regulator